MKLFCVRHGHAEQLPNLAGERPLTQEGIEEVGKVAVYLKHRGVYVVHLMHSGKLRAQQSAEILVSSLAESQAIEVCPLLGSDHPIAPLIDLIQEWYDDTMLVGHMPFISQLVSSLILGREGYDILCFPPGTVACLERIENSRWILNWVIRPDLVPDQEN
ncbi:phosphohistidine phosphatase SixA [Coxiella endosymbiont of Rhipicephalus microplus]|uniref:phosphohistidine phosphatase SixA n=1 Tax=Coxiella endosymbiont of Rhipicephalus microplus TaxID=1656186 RepID=UPI000C80275A|nr:phosphohistidine phosphatase SixA [Coxiella endosymbiont of Rhipicephalus microplus]PMB54986.1 phosphohistidine phosphatase SixA [Coxiella-like endosymbiont]